jgi:hypothetical protein
MSGTFWPAPVSRGSEPRWYGALPGAWRCARRTTLARRPCRRRIHSTSSQLAEVVFRGCWDGLLGAFRMVPAGSPHLPGWLGHWGYTALAPQVPLAELPTTAPETEPPDGGWRARARGARCAPSGPARRSLAPRPVPFRLVWPGGRMRAASAGCRKTSNFRSKTLHI